MPNVRRRAQLRLPALLHSTLSRPVPMSEERDYVTPFEFARWIVPSLLVLVGVVFFFLYHDAAPAMGAVLPTP